MCYAWNGRSPQPIQTPPGPRLSSTAGRVCRSLGRHSSTTCVSGAIFAQRVKRRAVQVLFNSHTGLSKCALGKKKSGVLNTVRHKKEEGAQNPPPPPPNSSVRVKLATGINLNLVKRDKLTVIKIK